MKDTAPAQWQISAVAIVPARSGSKGLPGKNIRNLAGKPLLAYSIEFAKRLDVRLVLCSTDTEEYAQVARSFGAEVPFLRSAEAASDTAMEEDILRDLYDNFDRLEMEYPKYWIWLRPTFVFRRLEHVKKCIEILEQDDSLTAARTVTQAESRLYDLRDGLLVPRFDDQSKSMVRRQDMRPGFRVFSTDVIRGHFRNTGEDFLGRRVAAVPTDKLCGLDIDDELDFALVEGMIERRPELVREYL